MPRKSEEHKSYFCSTPLRISEETELQIVSYNLIPHTPFLNLSFHRSPVSSVENTLCLRYHLIF